MMSVSRNERRPRWLLLLAVLVPGPLSACAGNGGEAQHPSSGGGAGPLGGRSESGGGADSGGSAMGGSLMGGDGSGGAKASGGSEPGPPGCGLEAAAFCDTFDEVASRRGRAGDLDTMFWSAGRLKPQLPTKPAPFIAAAAAAPDGCRDGLPSSLLPPFDILVCDPNQGIGSRHLFVSTALQNYGVNSVRVRQPFDFTGRTGKVVFDGELTTPNSLYGFVSVSITEEPTDATNFSLFQNNEGGALPRNAVTFQFQEPCPEVGAHLSSIVVMKDYHQDIVTFQNGPCVARARGQLSHVELEVSKSMVRIFSGAVGQASHLLQEQEVDLPFERGYVQLNVHNHATEKYGSGDRDYPQPFVAWTARFDNVGFDGPKLQDYREYEIPDAMEDQGSDGVAIGYVIGANQRAFTFEDVDPTGLDRATIALSLWVNQLELDSPSINYRVNGGTTRTRPLTDFEINLDGVGQGALALGLDIAVDELVKGNNTLELWTSGIGESYPPAVANLNLVLTEN